MFFPTFYLFTPSLSSSSLLFPIFLPSIPSYPNITLTFLYCCVSLPLCPLFIPSSYLPSKRSFPSFYPSPLFVSNFSSPFRFSFSSLLSLYIFTSVDPFPRFFTPLSFIFFIPHFLLHFLSLTFFPPFRLRDMWKRNLMCAEDFFQNTIPFFFTRIRIKMVWCIQKINTICMYVPVSYQFFTTP